MSRCGKAGRQVSSTLAAFVAKSIVLENRDGAFNLDHGMAPESVEHLLQACVSRLLEKDSPRMDTIRMQVAFDLAFVETEEQMEEMKLAGKKQIQRQIQHITDSAAAVALLEADKVNVVFRQIFELLMVHAARLHADDEDQKLNEREIAAALDSVFPRVGIKAFLQLPKRDMALQLEELTTIVLGIRLFNKEMGKGGIGISDTLAIASQLADSLLTRIDRDHKVFLEVCEDYAACIASLQGGKEEMPRIMAELANRRQFMAYLTNLLEQVEKVEATLSQHAQVFDKVVNELQLCVSSRATVPKEEIYPKFDLAARAWLEIEKQYQVVLAKKTCYEALGKFRTTFTKSITREMVEIARKSEIPASFDARGRSPKSPSSPSKPVPSLSSPGSIESKESKEIEEEEETKGEEQPQHLTVADANDVMDLPLEFQGYCAVTLVESKGLLLPGNPSHGMVRHEERYYVFHSPEAMRKFMDGPAQFRDGVITLAEVQPELVHLLSLQQHFPSIALSNLYRPATALNGHSLSDRYVDVKSDEIGHSDVGTETPVHFVETHKDPNYEWNEWALRRKALHLVNLRKASTVSSQTIHSHFRRHAQTQVFLPTHAHTQTGISTGTNTKKNVSYLHGLRGATNTEKQQVTRVNFQFDL